MKSQLHKRNYWIMRSPRLGVMGKSYTTFTIWWTFWSQVLSQQQKLEKNMQVCWWIAATWSERSSAEEGQGVCAESSWGSTFSAAYFWLHTKSSTSELKPRNPRETWKESHLLLFRAAERAATKEREKRTNWPVFLFRLCGTEGLELS